MLVVNSKKFNKFDKADPFLAIYQMCMARLKEIRDDNKLILESPARKVHINQSGEKENSAGGWGLYREKYIHDGNEYDIQYYETSFPDSKTGAETYRPRRYSFNGSIDPLLVDQDPDKVFFLVFISRHCEIMPELEDLQNKLKRDNRNIYWKVQNKKAEAKTKVLRKQEILAVENAIYFGDIEVLTVIAKNFKIGSVERLEPDQLRESLADTVLFKDHAGKHDQKRIELFMELMPKKGSKVMKEEALIPALAEDLKRLNIVTHKRIQGNKFNWMCGETVLCAHTPSMKEDEVLISYLEKNPDDRKKLEELVKEASTK